MKFWCGEFCWWKLWRWLYINASWFRKRVYTIIRKSLTDKNLRFVWILKRHLNNNGLLIVYEKTERITINIGNFYIRKKKKKQIDVAGIYRKLFIERYSLKFNTLVFWPETEWIKNNEHAKWYLPFPQRKYFIFVSILQF